jgi:VWFA-related protein
MTFVQLRRFLVIMLIAAFLFDTTGTISGQQKIQNELPVGKAEVTVKVNVNLLTTDVTVVGKPTGELRREDFVLFDKGVSQELTYFSRNELPLAMAIVLDTSTALAPLQQLAALTALRRLKPSDQAALFTSADKDRLKCKLTEDKLLVAKEIGHVRAGEDSNPFDVLFDAVQYLKENAPRRRRVIVLISDGCFDMSTLYSPEKCLTALLEADVTLFDISIPGIFIQFGSVYGQSKQNPLASCPSTSKKVKWLVEETDGDLFSSVEDVMKRPGSDRVKFSRIKQTQTKAALEQAIFRLREQYTVGFNPPDSGIIGKSHSLVIKFSDNNRCPGCKAIIRGSYYAAKTVAQLASPDIPQEKIQPAANEDEEMQRSIISAAAGVEDWRCDDIQLEASASMQTGATGAKEVKIAVKIAADTVQFETKENQRIGKLRIAFIYADEKRKILGSDLKTIEIRRNADENEQDAKSDILYSALTPFNPACKLIKVVVLDMANDQIGSKEITVSKKKN